MATLDHEAAASRAREIASETIVPDARAHDEAGSFPREAVRRRGEPTAHRRGRRLQGQAWDKARRGIAIAHGEGFRVRLTSSSTAQQFPLTSAIEAVRLA